MMSTVSSGVLFLIFFFQAEDGIRDWSVTGVQTCALPICPECGARKEDFQISTISKSSLRAPHSGQVQFMGTSSQRVPAAMPSSGRPAASSYTQPQMRHIHVLYCT